MVPGVLRLGIDLSGLVRVPSLLNTPSRHTCVSMRMRQEIALRDIRRKLRPRYRYAAGVLSWRWYGVPTRELEEAEEAVALRGIDVLSSF